MRKQRGEPVFYVRVKQPAKSAVGTAAASASPVQALLLRAAQLEQMINAVAIGAGDREQTTLLEDVEKNRKELFDVLAKLDKLRAQGVGAGAAQPAPQPPPDLVDLSRAVLAFVYEESEKKSDQLKLTVENGDLRWFDSPLFEKGTMLVVAWGYVGHLVPPREVVVQKISGNRTLTIECAGKGQLMNKQAKTRAFHNVTRADVVRQVALENGFGPEAQDIEDGPPYAAPVGPPGAVAVQLLQAIRDEAQGALTADGPEQAQSLKTIGVLVGRALATGVGATVFKAIQGVGVQGLVAAGTGGSMAGLLGRIVLLSDQGGAVVQAAAAAAAKAAATKPAPKGEVVRYGTINQAGQTDAQFLKRLADLQGFEFYIDFDGLHWHSRRFNQKPVKELMYFLPPQVGDIIDFNLDNDTQAKPSAVTVKGIDPLTKQAIDVTANDANTPRPTLAPTPELPTTQKVVDPVTGETKLVTPSSAAVPGTAVVATSEPSATAAKAAAAGMFTRSQQSALKINFDIVGDPGILCKSVIKVGGLGKRLSGRYYIHEMTHTLDSGGYKAQAKTRTDGTNTGAGGGVKPASAAQPNTQDPAKPATGDAAGALTPKKVVDPVTGETKTIYVDDRGRDDALKAK